jgi:hypothetical protein
MTRYDQDFYAWTQEQATLLKEKRFAELDIDNLVEELESMGRSDKRELRSRLIVLLAHRLTWVYQPTKRSPSWENTIAEQHEQIQWLLEESPSLCPVLPALLSQAYPAARRTAAAETELPQATFPVQCPWSVEEVLQETAMDTEEEVQ